MCFLGSVTKECLPHTSLNELIKKGCSKGRAASPEVDFQSAGTSKGSQALGRAFVLGGLHRLTSCVILPHPGTPVVPRPPHLPAEPTEWTPLFPHLKPREGREAGPLRAPAAPGSGLQDHSQAPHLGHTGRPQDDRTGGRINE